MTDWGGFTLLTMTSLVLGLVCIAIVPVNRQAIWARRAAFMLIGSIFAVGTIYLGFALSVDTGMAWRPHGKIIAGVFAAAFTFCLKKAWGWKPAR